MDANDLFQAGKLQEAIEAQVAVVKANPADQGKRLFLFELLAFAGELERARRQIDALQPNEIELQAALAEYRGLLDSEDARRKVFHEGTQPKFLTQPQPEHIRLRLEALAHLRADRRTEAAECLAQAAEATPTLGGRLNDKPFDSLRDCDDLFGGVLEVFAQGSYFWIPLEKVELIETKPPDSLAICSGWPPAWRRTAASRARSSCRPSIPTPSPIPTAKSKSATRPTGSGTTAWVRCWGAAAGRFSPATTPPRCSNSANWKSMPNRMRPRRPKAPSLPRTLGLPRSPCDWHVDRHTSPTR